MYEIPDELKRLYRHWDKHTTFQKENTDTSGLNKELLREIGDFASERMHIWHKRCQNETPPYTDDPILQNYRFCNIYRELDRQTIEIHTLLKPLRDTFDLWLLNLFFCRFVCNPATIQETGLLSFDKNNNRRVYERLLNKPRPKYGSAYVFPISVIQKSDHPTRETFFCFYLPSVMKDIAKEIQSFEDLPVAEGVARVLPVLGFPFTFHTTEVLIDAAYQYPDLIDLFAKFPIGPGAKPTMQALSKEEPEQACLTLTQYEIPNFPYLTYNGNPVYLSAENWEGIGCEFRKYTNLRKGLGRKRKYTIK